MSSSSVPKPSRQTTPHKMALGHMAHGHDNALSVEPGDTGSLTMTFASAGSIVIGCHEPGHYDAGMKAKLTVVD